MARLLARVFYRKIEIVELAKLPIGRPLLIVGNHGNALIDAMLLLGFLPVPIRFLAKSTLWQHPVVKYLVRLAGAIPVYRKQDEGSDTLKNVSTFAASHEVLKSAGVIAMFPEGVSHASPHLMPMKTGAARIALEAEELYGPLGIRIVPVGLIFEARGRFRSAVMIQVGEPIDLTEPSNLIAPGADSGDVSSANRTVVRELTERIDFGLRQVTLNYQSWQEARLIERAAEIFQRESSATAANFSLASGFSTKMTVLKRYQELRARFPQPVEDLARATREYDLLLGFLGLRDAQVAADYSLMRSVQFTLKSLLTLFLWLPLAALGTLLNWVPYRTPGWVVRSVKLEADVEATYRVLSAVAVFPIVWVAEAVSTGRLFGAHMGLAVGVIAPLTGYVALRFHETSTRFGEEVRAYLFLKSRRVVAAELKMKRNLISREMNELISLAGEREESV